MVLCAQTTWFLHTHLVLPFREISGFHVHGYQITAEGVTGTGQQKNRKSVTILWLASCF